MELNSFHVQPTILLEVIIGSKFLMVTVRFVVWRFETNRKINSIDIPKPTEEALYEIKEAMGKIPDYAGDSPLNTESYKRKNDVSDQVFCFCFQGYRMFSGYGDGLICFWDL